MNRMLKSEQKHVIKVISIGNILEWFDVYSFGYLAEVLAKNFFPFVNSINSLLFSFIVFGIGFVSRPIGGIVFGRIGDHIGRKRAFILSIVVLTVPTFLIGLLPTYNSVGILAPVLLVVMRLLQSVPTGGELPGAICFLYENADENNRCFMTSWSAVSNQIGALIAIIESVVMESCMSPEFFEAWGWRISFITGGFIGLFGIYLRHALHETPLFERLKESHRIDHDTISHLINHNRKDLSAGVLFGVVDAASFYFLAAYFPSLLIRYFRITQNQSLLISFIVVGVITILVPIFGYLGDKINNKKILMWSSAAIIILLFPIAHGIKVKDIQLVLTLSSLTLFPISCITALIAFQVARLFSTPIRFTGTGISMNFSDGLIGGFTPAVSILLFRLTNSEASFCWYIMACAGISFFSYKFLIKN